MLSGTFGIELEFGSTSYTVQDRYREIALAAVRSEYPTATLSSSSSPNTWASHHEMGSGYEVTTPALTWRRWTRAKRVVDNLRNTRGLILNNSYGTHVHFGVENLRASSEEIRNLQWFWWQHQAVIYQMVKSSRRGSSYCSRLVRPPSVDVENRRATITRQVNAVLRRNGITRTLSSGYYWGTVLSELGLTQQTYDNNRDRYKSLNVSGIGNGRNTLEVRLHHGTLDSSEIEEWVELMLEGVLAKGLEREYTTSPTTPYAANAAGVAALKRDLTSPALSRIITARLNRYRRS